MLPLEKLMWFFIPTPRSQLLAITALVQGESLALRPWAQLLNPSAGDATVVNEHGTAPPARTLVITGKSATSFLISVMSSTSIY